MQAGDLLTVIAILATAYSFLSEAQRDDLRIRISKIDFLLIFSPIVASLFVLYSSPLRLIISENYTIPWFFGFNEEIALLSYTILLLIMTFKKFNSKRLSEKSLSKLKKISEYYIRNKK